MFIQKEKNEYKPYSDEQFNKINLNKIYDKQIDEFCSGSDFNVYRRYTQNGYFERINIALRSGYTNDFMLQSDIRQLDELFSNIPQKLRNKTAINVYRGIRLHHDDLKSVLSGKSNSNIYIDKGLVSTSKSKQVAKQYAYGDDGAIMDIIIPPNSSIIDDELLPSYARSQMNGEREVLLPRNSAFQILDYDEKSKVIKAIYLGQKKPLEMPKLYESSGYDILADLNKNLINDSR